MSKYIENFKSVKDIIDAYFAPKDALRGAKILLAWYGYGDFCGSSLVVFEKDGKLFEVNGSHCSCNGLEDQWEPEETNWESLSMRKIYGGYEGSSEASELLKKLVSKNLKKKDNK